jgi:hypothetical protein
MFFLGLDPGSFPGMRSICPAQNLFHLRIKVLELQTYQIFTFRQEIPDLRPGKIDRVMYIVKIS